MYRVVIMMKLAIPEITYWCTKWRLISGQFYRHIWCIGIKSEPEVVSKHVRVNVVWTQ